MWILGISLSHNGGVALVKDGKVSCAIQAERLARVKRQAIYLTNDAQLVTRCVQYVMKYAGIDYKDIDSIAITTPWHVDKLAPAQLAQLIGDTSSNSFTIEYIPHHYSHAEYAVHYADNKQMPMLSLVIDGSGSYESDRALHTLQEAQHPECISTTRPDGKEVVSCYLFENNKLELVYRFSPSIDPSFVYNQHSKGLIQSIGHYWRWASWYCCGNHNDAGKVMGLAAYADKVTLLESFASWRIEKGISVDYQQLFHHFKDPNFLSKDIADNTHYRQVAGMVQHDTTKIILTMLRELKTRHNAKNLSFSGGVALNVVTNEKIIRSGLFDHVILNGSCEDNGTAIGAALAVSRVHSNETEYETIFDYYGCNYSDESIKSAINSTDLQFEELTEEQLYQQAAQKLSDGQILGWFQGRSEFGPRALGNRSILADPRSVITKPLLDVRMKQRDRYRPYAPAVLVEKARDYFDLDGDSPVMMREADVKINQLPAVRHIDNTARVQTVSERDNPQFYKLIKAFEKITGIAVILNTSFNQAGEPIVESPTDAVNSFNKSNLDCLYIGNYCVTRSSA